VIHVATNIMFLLGGLGMLAGIAIDISGIAKRSDLGYRVGFLGIIAAAWALMMELWLSMR
jgi:hypothetical protein